MAEVLTRVMQNMGKLGSGDPAKRTNTNSGTIEADEATNALINTPDTDEMQALEAVIQRLDIRRAQVLVEAIIAELEIIDGQGRKVIVPENVPLGDETHDVVAEKSGSILTVSNRAVARLCRACGCPKAKGSGI